jgi:hypothetical protein
MKKLIKKYKIIRLDKKQFKFLRQAVKEIMYDEKEEKDMEKIFKKFDI